VRETMGSLFIGHRGPVRQRFMRDNLPALERWKFFTII
jgi:hypothetical protein